MTPVSSCAGCDVRIATGSCTYHKGGLGVFCSERCRAADVTSNCPWSDEEHDLGLDLSAWGEIAPCIAQPSAVPFAQTQTPNCEIDQSPGCCCKYMHTIHAAVYLVCMSRTHRYEPIKTL